MTIEFSLSLYQYQGVKGPDQLKRNQSWGNSVRQLTQNHLMRNVWVQNFGIRNVCGQILKSIYCDFPNNFS